MNYGSKLLTMKQAAAYVSERYYDVSYRTLEAYPDLPRRIVNKMRRIRTEELDAAAQRRIAAADARLPTAA